MEGGKEQKEDPLFFCLSLFESTEICSGCTKMKISYMGGNFLTPPPTFDYTPGYAPVSNTGTF